MGSKASTDPNKIQSSNVIFVRMLNFNQKIATNQLVTHLGVSVNAYIMDLIEKDMRGSAPGHIRELFGIQESIDGPQLHVPDRPSLAGEVTS